VLGVLTDLLDARTPVTGFDPQVSEPLAGLYCVGSCRLDGTLIRLAGEREIALIGRHVAEFNPERRRLRLRLRALDLELEQTPNHGQLAQLPVDGLRLGERLGQPRVELERILEVLERPRALQKATAQYAGQSEMQTGLRRRFGRERDRFLERVG